jgi:hypothetical protein
MTGGQSIHSSGFASSAIRPCPRRSRYRRSCLRRRKSPRPSNVPPTRTSFTPRCGAQRELWAVHPGFTQTTAGRELSEVTRVGAGGTLKVAARATHGHQPMHLSGSRGQSVIASRRSAATATTVSASSKLALLAGLSGGVLRLSSSRGAPARPRARARQPGPRWLARLLSSRAIAESRTPPTHGGERSRPSTNRPRGSTWADVCHDRPRTARGTALAHVSTVRPGRSLKVVGGLRVR